MTKPLWEVEREAIVEALKTNKSYIQICEELEISIVCLTSKIRLYREQGLDIPTGHKRRFRTWEKQLTEKQLTSCRALERKAIINALEECNHNRTHAAEKLEISVRTVRTKIRLYREQGFDIPPGPMNGGHYVTNK